MQVLLAITDDFKTLSRISSTMPTPTIKKKNRTRPIPEIHICTAAELIGRSENNNNYIGRQRGEGIQLLNPHKSQYATSKDVVDSREPDQVCAFSN